MAVALVTDSTSNIPPELAAERQIHIAPLYILWGEDSYKDGVDLKEPELFQRMRTSTTMPQTSQVSVQDFVTIFQQAQNTENAEAIVCAVISTDLSGTYASAIQAAESVDIPVHVIDTRQTSWALGFSIFSGAQARDTGASAEEIVQTIQHSAENVCLLFTVESLEYLRRGGRIGQASYLLGSALNIKPILQLKEGVIHAVDKVRTRKRAVEHLLKLAEQYVAGRPVKRFSVIHAGVEDEAQNLLDEGVVQFKPSESYVTYISAVLGVHVGPGTLGVIVEWEN
ncbi:MAG: DegV family protein [Anaerolineae bacterium]|nr:DegV family protein [Anaerolineae bacterium]